MKSQPTKTLLAAACGIASLSCAQAAVTLVEIDFSGSGAVDTIAAANAQFTVKNAAVTFDDTVETLTAVGGALSAGSWNYDGTNTAAVNTDLHTGSTFGSPSRFDLDLGTAAAGETFTITTVQVDIRASNSAGTLWDFGYRDGSGTTHLLGAVSISTQGGTDPITTYSIDVSGENLIATDSTTAWSTAGNGELRWSFYEPTATGNDNFQVDAIRLIGTSSVPEPSSIALLGLGGLFLLRRKR